MEDFMHFENFSVNNIIFLDFMKKSNEVLITIPKTDIQVQNQFKIQVVAYIEEKFKT